jgi:class 3 adenylate cyclase
MSRATAGLMERDEAGTLARLKTLRRDLIDLKVAEHKGRIVKTTGDGILVEFPSIVEAVACAVAVQRGMAERNTAVPAPRRSASSAGPRKRKPLSKKRSRSRRSRSICMPEGVRPGIGRKTTLTC